MPDTVATLFQVLPNLAKLASEIVYASDKAKSNTQLIEFQSALISLQSLIASVQQENATLASEKGNAEEELRRMKDWEAEKQRYKLAAPFPGCMVMALQEAMSNGQTAHYLCANCFQQGKPSILQGREGYPRPKGEGRVLGAYVCPACRSEAFTNYMNVEAPKYLEHIAPSG